MKPIIIVGTVIVHLALISYGIGIVSAQLKNGVTRPILVFLGWRAGMHLCSRYAYVVGPGGLCHRRAAGLFRMSMRQWGV